jgi:hypothetical protein
MTGGAIVKLKVSPGSVPLGNYAAQFSGIESTTNERYGEGLRWKFVVSQGPQAGQVASRVTGLKPSPKNGCGKMLTGLVGRPLDLEEEIEVDQYIGRSYLIVVAPSENGGSKIDTVIPAPPAT